MIYSVDASALLDGWVRYYPPDVLPSLWDQIDSLVEDGRLIAPVEVKLEIARGNDDLSDWLKTRGKMFCDSDEDLENRVIEIVNRFPQFVPDRSQDGVWADPYVIALAQEHSALVLTGEKLADPQARKPKMPNVCRAFGTGYIDLLHLIRREGWKF